jgi:hypothetical protein
VALLAIDEAAWMSEQVVESVRAMLAVSGAKLMCASTPAGGGGGGTRRGSTRASPGGIEVPATECLRIPAGFLEQERRELGERAYLAEYECQFTDTRGAVFRAEDIDATGVGRSVVQMLERRHLVRR